MGFMKGPVFLAVRTAFMVHFTAAGDTIRCNTVLHFYREEVMKKKIGSVPVILLLMQSLPVCAAERGKRFPKWKPRKRLT